MSVKKIEVKSERECLYYDILNLIRELRTIQGPIGVNATLRRHPDIFTFLSNFQSEKLSHLKIKLDRR